MTESLFNQELTATMAQGLSKEEILSGLQEIFYLLGDRIEENK